MKLNLLFDNTQEIQAGYFNIDPLGQDDLMCKDDLRNLPSVDDAECDEIRAVGVIDYFKPEAVKELVRAWCKKLRHNGLLTIGFIDLYQLTRAIVNRNVDHEEANKLLHGTQEKGWKTRRSTFSMGVIVKLLESFGLKILTKRFNGYYAIVKARRP